MNQYNREYSIMVNEVEKFLKEVPTTPSRALSASNDLSPTTTSEFHSTSRNYSRTWAPSKPPSRLGSPWRRPANKETPNWFQNRNMRFLLTDSSSACPTSSTILLIARWSLKKIISASNLRNIVDRLRRGSELLEAQWPIASAVWPKVLPHKK